MLPDSDDTRMIFEFLERREDWIREWTMNTGAIEEVVYIFTSLSQFTPSLEEKSSVAK